MYCTVPENGGHTNFRNANVHVKPKAGSAVFFSYIDPEELVMDTGFTEHSSTATLPEDPDRIGQVPPEVDSCGGSRDPAPSER